MENKEVITVVTIITIIFAVLSVVSDFTFTGLSVKGSKNNLALTFSLITIVLIAIILISLVVELIKFRNKE